jgi:hypothetical protein
MLAQRQAPMRSSCLLYRISRPVFGVIALFVALTALAQRESDFDERERSWKEIEAKIPSYPKPENLVSFGLAKASPHQFFVDSLSLSWGEDGVMRYVLVIKTAGGATNVTFEGIRCETREQKYYAVGNANGGWTPARNPQWRQIGNQESSQHGALFDEYFCANPRRPATPAQALQALKFGGGARFGRQSNE